MLINYYSLNSIHLWLPEPIKSTIALLYNPISQPPTPRYAMLKQSLNNPIYTAPSAHQTISATTPIIPITTPTPHRPAPLLAASPVNTTALVPVAPAPDGSVPVTVLELVGPTGVLVGPVSDTTTTLLDLDEEDLQA
jgi:hypothetical protein